MDFELGPYRLEVATDFGPRITGLRRDGGPEILATLAPDVVIDHRAGTYTFRGGHRVWAAPEIPEVTYAPDDHRCLVSQKGDRIEVTAPPDLSGIVKRIRVTRDDDRLAVESRLEFTTTLGMKLAPWSITQLPLGGVAILPLLGGETAPLPNRQIVLWPYTDLVDSRLRLNRDSLLLEAREGENLKIGVGPDPGRLGYWRGGSLFVKEIENTSGRSVPDFGAVGQVFLGGGFCELESVGAMSDAREGHAVSISETWSVVDCADVETANGLTVEGVQRWAT